jgi:Domain of unknown function (DUF4411)
MAYLLDANVFIEARRRYYGLDFCPAFWDWLVAANARGLVFSIERIRDELIGAGDELSDWVRALPAEFFFPTDQGTLVSLAAAVDWARRQSFRQSAVALFADDADAYLVAHAAAHGHSVVTLEQPSDGEKQVKIPNACIGLGVKYLNTFDLLRREGARFILG